MRQLTIQERGQLVELLLACPAMQDSHQRGGVLAFLEARVRNAIPRHAQSRADVLSIVTICNNYPGALNELLVGVRFFDAGTVAMQAVEEFWHALVSDDRGSLPNTNLSPRPSYDPGFIELLRQKLVTEHQLHDVSRDARHAAFALIGFRETPLTIDLVAFVVADGLTHEEIVALRTSFFETTRRLPHNYRLRPGLRNPNGLLCFVFVHGCPEQMGSFIQKQSQISHASPDGGVMVAWSLDMQAQHVRVHNNPVSLVPPVIILVKTVFPGRDWLLGCLREYHAQVSAAEQPARTVETSAAPHQGRVAVCLAAHPKLRGGVDARPDEILIDWVEAFGSGDPTPLTWEQQLLPDLERYVRMFRREQKSVIDLRAFARNAAGLAFGAVFCQRAGFQIHYTDNRDQVWRTDAAVSVPAPLTLTETLVDNDGNDLVVELAVTQGAARVTEAVDEWLVTHAGQVAAGTHRRIGKRLLLALHREPYELTPEEGAAMAQQVCALLSTQSRPGATIHLFGALPLGVSILIGWGLKAGNPIQWYELNGEGQYQAACVLRP
ncbi:SAVED domain-containing protein [Candidatus Chloroploca sp. Khr17]|uniref:effector-associated domain 2-containing protein n=1 Tax=Candidatus Chloroploca sp. Khr17 TaxID=2496869 RepID=UPI00101BAD27|nr:SAVED domain-containing protein [Candidatus Chloroploca sp. Khr17]